ncbi:hypothetical protein GQ600_15645 [Phytophthora cactorum]|nr:hypothetical protein GQ600_15645 [Phytophthora cactorum]
MMRETSPRVRLKGVDQIANFENLQISWLKMKQDRAAASEEDARRAPDTVDGSVVEGLQGKRGNEAKAIRSLGDEPREDKRATAGYGYSR